MKQACDPLSPPSIIESRLALVLLFAAIAFVVALVWPIMQHGYAAGGDDVVHMAYNHEAEAILSQKGTLFGWSYLFGIGAPIFLFRPPLQYATVAIVYKLLGGLVSLSAIHKTTYLVFLALYPAAIYYLMRALRLRPIMAAAAALFALTPISMWGHTIDAYFRLGIAKQLIAITLFPFAMGKLHGTVARGEAVLPASLLIVLCFLSHPYVPYCLLLVNGVHVLTLLLGGQWRSFLTASARYTLAWLLAGGLLAVYLVPFYTSPEIQALEFSASWRHGFEVVCSTTAKTINHYLSGGIFDTTRWGVFGGGEWGWQNNSHTGRWPILSGLSLLGLIVCVAQRRRFPFALMLSAFLLSFLLFLGPDDLPVLERIPFQDNFQYIHEIFLLDLFAICLAGIGLGAVGGVLIDRSAGRPDDAARRGWRLPWPVGTALVLALCGLAAFQPWRDRWIIGNQIVRTTTFDTHHRRPTAVSLRTPVNADLAEMLDILREPEPAGRFYGAPQGPASGQELFYFTALPALVNRTDVICGFFSAEVAGANKTIIEQFRNAIPKSRNLIELLNVRYLIAAASNRGALEPANAYADLVRQNRYWLLWRVRDPFHHFDLLRTRPVAVIGDIPAWRELNHRWLEEFQDAGDAATFPYLVRLGDHAALSHALDPAAYAAAYLLGTTPPSPSVHAELLGFHQAGGVVYSRIPIPGIPTQPAPLVAEAHFRELDREQPRVTGTATELLAERERHRSEITVDGDTFALFKMAYYRSWTARVNDEPAPLYELSPGFMGVRLPAGTHRIDFVYAGPNNRALGSGITLVALLLGLGLTLAVRLRIPRWQQMLALLKPPARDTVDVTALRPRAHALLWAGVFALLGILYVREQFLRIPIPIRPARHALMEHDVLLDWNALSATGVTYEAQIMDGKGGNTRIVYARADIRDTNARKQRGLAPDRDYQWRVRSFQNGRLSAWSRPVPFRTHPDTRDATDAPWSITVDTRAAGSGPWPLSGHSTLPDGAYIHLRLYRADTGERVQSTAVRLIDGRFTGQLVPPASGWPTGTVFTLHADFLLEDQAYPVTEILGERGEAFASRPLPPGHSHLVGLQATGMVRDALLAPPPPLRPTADWTLAFTATHMADGNLVVRGATGLPNNTMLRVTVTPDPRVDPVVGGTATVQDGNWQIAFPLPPSGAYRVAVTVSPDRQYQSVRAALGEEGQAIAARPRADALTQPLLGLRAAMPVNPEP